MYEVEKKRNIALSRVFRSGYSISSRSVSLFNASFFCSSVCTSVFLAVGDPDGICAPSREHLAGVMFGQPAVRQTRSILYLQLQSTDSAPAAEKAVLRNSLVSADLAGSVPSWRVMLILALSLQLAGLLVVTAARLCWPHCC